MTAKIPRGLKVPIADDDDIERLHERTQEPGNAVNDSWNRSQYQYQ